MDRSLLEGRRKPFEGLKRKTGMCFEHEAGDQSSRTQERVQYTGMGLQGDLLRAALRDTDRGLILISISLQSGGVYRGSSKR